MLFVHASPHSHFAPLPLAPQLREAAGNSNFESGRTERAIAACEDALDALTSRLESATEKLRAPGLSVSESVELVRLCKECVAAMAEIKNFAK